MADLSLVLPESTTVIVAVGLIVIALVLAGLYWLVRKLFAKRRHGKKDKKGGKGGLGLGGKGDFLPSTVKTMAGGVGAVRGRGVD